MARRGDVQDERWRAGAEAAARDRADRFGGDFETVGDGRKQPARVAVCAPRQQRRIAQVAQ
jgi:hypothetical protein